MVALVVKNLPAKAGNVRDMGSVPGLGRSSRVGNGNPLQYSYIKGKKKSPDQHFLPRGSTPRKTIPFPPG